MNQSTWEVLDGYRVQPFVLEPGAGATARTGPQQVPSWESIKDLLPALVWDGHPDVEAAFGRGWELAWQHLRAPEPGPFTGVFLDSAFNGNVFLWDAAFAQRFMVYARRVLAVQLLDGFYTAQTKDGWICRTMTPAGQRVWERHDPSSTGPNVLAWIELECAERTGDLDRLAAVLPALKAYHRWMRRYRTWPTGAYWSTGWGCGMDGLPRLPAGVDPNFEHGGVTWVDATLQALLSARSILRAAELTASPVVLDDLVAEAEALERFVRDRLWDAELGAFTDLAPEGHSMGTLHVGTFWALLAAELIPERRSALVAHLRSPASFGRPFPVPALARSHPAYREDGGYWLGGVWAPTTLMVLDGLRAVGEHELAHDLGRQHLEMVSQVVSNTRTIWENYSPEQASPGSQARADFVGWGGASVITVGIEQALGIRTHGDTINWNVRLVERHGVRRLPVGATATVDLLIETRTEASEPPVVVARTDSPVTLELTWPGGTRTLTLEPEAQLAHH